MSCRKTGAIRPALLSLLLMKITLKHVERFIQKVTKTDGCWLWNANKDEHGYGLVWIQNRRYFAHRVSYQIHTAVEPGDLHVLHRCDNPSCVNPDHLFLGTQRDNVLDCAAKGRTSRGEKRYSAKLTDETARRVIELRKSGVLIEAVAKMFGVSPATVSKVANRKIWKHVTQ